MKKLLIITILLSAIHIKICAQQEFKKVHSPHISTSLELCDLSDSLTFKYIRSLSAGALVGMGVGIVTAYSDTLASSWWPITWFLAMNARCDLVSSIGNDMNAHEVKYHDGLMRLSALAASWVSWYKTYYHLNGSSPFAKS